MTELGLCSITQKVPLVCIHCQILNVKYIPYSFCCNPTTAYVCNSKININIFFIEYFLTLIYTSFFKVSICRGAGPFQFPGSSRISARNIPFFLYHMKSQIKYSQKRIYYLLSTNALLNKYESTMKMCVWSESNRCFLETIKIINKCNSGIQTPVFAFLVFLKTFLIFLLHFSRYLCFLHFLHLKKI